LTASSHFAPSPRRQHWLEQVDAAQRRGDMALAAQLSQQALAEGVEHPGLLNLAAMGLFNDARYEDALALMKRARALSPKDPHVLNGLGLCLAMLGRVEAAQQAYDAAIGADPRYAAAPYNKGSLLEDLNDLTAARAGYLRAVELEPDYVDALAGLAWLAAQNGDADEARAYAGRATGLAPSHVRSRMALALADLQAGDLDAADARLTALFQDQAVSEPDRAIVLGMLGDLMDGRGATAEAFAAYRACKALLKRIHGPRLEAPAAVSMLAVVERAGAWFETASPEPWRTTPPARPRAADPAAHIFLVGFPRSGTTLLENVLAAHTDVVSLEERDCLAPAIADYLIDEGGLGRLATISSGEAMRRREDYWTAVRSFGVEPRRRVFIDKMPLGTMYLPLIARLFPGARVLFALRDPRDVVLSCYRRRFGMNASMYQLLTLEGAAAFYATVMRLAALCCEILPLDLHVVRYEALVEDLEGVAGEACRFLGLQWQGGMADFAAKARARGVTTPSAAQVARGLNREGIGTWRRYRRELEPVMPVLQPWAEAFGYPAD
jgi:tetratricopeptide (TPR) repeat protein